MSDAFRSGLEAAQERLRRAEEEAATLREEVTKLETQLSPARKPKNLVLGAFLCAALGAVVAGAIVSLIAASEETRLEAALRQTGEVAESLAKERETLKASHAEAIAKTEGALQTCQASLSACPSRPPAPPCRCQAGDPLCVCAELDRGAVAAALGAVNVKTCATEAGSRTLHAAIVFEPSGRVSLVSIDEGSAPDAEKACLARLIREVRIPSFQGAPVHVGKSYTLGKP